MNEMTNMMLEGVLPVHKPAGMTSHDVVARARRILHIRRIGHTGTLDPDVTGVLPLCIGKATRIVEYMQELPKTYEAELVIGFATDTEDISGKVIERAEQVDVTEQQLHEVFKQFVGEIEQIPPMYSAVKIEGKRLYELAREGKEVERKARTVTIHRISLLSVQTNGEYPLVRFRVTCSKGTYIRTLCADIGKALGFPAVMSKLVRTETGGVTLDRCMTLEEIEQLAAAGTLQQALIPIDEAIAHLPAVRVSSESAAKAVNGIAIAVLPSDLPEQARHQLVRVYETKTFIGIFQYRPDSQTMKPVKIFSAKR